MHEFGVPNEWQQAVINVYFIKPNAQFLETSVITLGTNSETFNTPATFPI